MTKKIHNLKFRNSAKLSCRIFTYPPANLQSSSATAKTVFTKYLIYIHSIHSVIFFLCAEKAETRKNCKVLSIIKNFIIFSLNAPTISCHVHLSFLHGHSTSHSADGFLLFADLQSIYVHVLWLFYLFPCPREERK